MSNTVPFAFHVYYTSRSRELTLCDGRYHDIYIPLPNDDILPFVVNLRLYLINHVETVTLKMKQLIIELNGDTITYYRVKVYDSDEVTSPKTFKCDSAKLLHHLTRLYNHMCQYLYRSDIYEQKCNKFYLQAILSNA